MPKTESNQNDWSACREGEIKQLTARLQGRRRVRSLQRFASVASLLAVLILTGYFFSDRLVQPETSIAGIRCGEVIDYAKQFMSGELDTGLTAKIQRHLNGCPYCQNHYSQLRSKSPGQSAARPGTTRNRPRQSMADVAWLGTPRGDVLVIARR